MQKATLILKEIIGYQSNKKAIKINDPLYVNGQKKHTTAGWQIECKWSDGSTSWVPLKDLKHLNPVELAEFAVSSQINEEPAFAWWVRYTLQKCDRIIKKVKSAKYWKKTHKFGIELPKTVKEAYEINC